MGQGNIFGQTARVQKQFNKRHLVNEGEKGLGEREDPCPMLHGGERGQSETSCRIMDVVAPENPKGRYP
jgi:hypothetical protein